MNAEGSLAALLEADMKGRGLGLREYADAIDIDHAILSRFLNGKQVGVNRENARKMASALHLDASQVDHLLAERAAEHRGRRTPNLGPTDPLVDAGLRIVLGEIQIKLDAIDAKVSDLATTGAVDMSSSALVVLGGRLTPLRVPVLRDVASIGSATTHADGGDELLYSPPAADADHVYVGVEVRGDCLEPSGILSGHYAIVDCTARPRAGAIVLARREDELLVKRLRADGDLRYLEADQHWDPLLVADGVELIGVCVAFQYRPTPKL